MTSRNCTKSYNRKVNNVAAGSIQFDKLFRENSNRPSAAKSTGTCGKWGITSFTSIRSSRVHASSSDNHGSFKSKRPRVDYGNQNTSNKESKFVYSEEKEKEVKVDFIKPKKFFKSRSVAPSQGSKKDSTSSTTSTRTTGSTSQNHMKTYKQQKQTPSKSKVTEIVSEPETNKDESKPPIVLRICKGTARLLSADDSATPVTKTQNPDCKNESNYRSNSNAEDPSSKPSTVLTENSEMRTTRSRAKNLGITVVPTKLSPEPTITYPSEPVEPLIGHDQPLPTSTQELIAILSNDEDKNAMQMEQENISNEEESIKEEISKDKILDTNSVLNEKSNYHIINKNTSNKSDTIVIKNVKDVITEKCIEQDCQSLNSDDSDSVTGSSQNENTSQYFPSETKPSSPIKNNNLSKLATNNKKGSIFKSRQTGTANGNNKRRALYKHKWSDNDKEAKQTGATNRVDAPSSSSTAAKVSEPTAFDEEFENNPLTRVVTYPQGDDNLQFGDDDMIVTSLRCSKNVKGFYTVVKNVKKAHQIQESGEFQEFNDDVEYILDTLRENNPNATRCLSAIRLASKCMAPAFRMHVRAHGIVAKFFKALQDATKDQSLALCTATVMFVMSQDRLAMDLDRDCLELMLSLLESDASHNNALEDCGLSHAELLKNKEKVRQLCTDIQQQGHAKHLNLENITAGQLAMETLLSLTSKRAGEWFKEELRELGGLEHIVKTISECHRHIDSSYINKFGWDEPLLDKLQKVDRCLRVLENVTHMNEENQNYLLKYDDSILVLTLTNLYNICGKEIISYPTFDVSDKSSKGAIIRECLFATIKVLINLTHQFNSQSCGGKIVGSQNDIVNRSLQLILQVPKSIPEEKRFDLMMLGLILLTNLIEQCDDNKMRLVNSNIMDETGNENSGLACLINLFYSQEELARLEEQRTDAILDGKKDTDQSGSKSTTSKSQEEFIEETVAKLLQKAGKHMEHTLIAAYVVLLLGNLIMNNKDFEDSVRSKLQDGTFSMMISVLQKFFNFMNLTASNEVSSCGIAATEKVIKFLQTADARLIQDKQNDSSGSSAALDDSITIDACS